jgi:hypothetical protein
MFKTIGFLLFSISIVVFTACGDDSSANSPESNNISCKVRVSASEDTVVTTQKTTTGKTIKTIVIGKDSIAESTQNFYYDEEIKHFFLDNCEDSDSQKCEKDNITVYATPRAKGQETTEAIKNAEEKACKAFLSAKMAQN